MVTNYKFEASGLHRSTWGIQKSGSTQRIARYPDIFPKDMVDLIPLTLGGKWNPGM